MKKQFENNIIPVITLLVGLLTILILSYLTKIPPFGDYNFLQIDFYHQYAPMLSEMYDKVKEGSGLIYNFNLGLGIPFYRNYMNYLSSPLNFIIFLFKKEHLITVFSYLILLKAVLSSVTMSIYFNYKYKDKNYIYVALSLLYGFSAYFTAYYWNIMWLDSMFLLPLITLGIEKIIDDNKFSIYIVSLAVSIFSNYYIGFMLAIYSVIYFILYLSIVNNNKEKKEKMKITGKFILSSLLAGLLISFMIVPLFLSLAGISATGDNLPTGQYYAFTFVEFLIKHLNGSIPTVLASGTTNAPNVYSSIIVVYLSLLLFFNKNINYKTKTIKMFLIILVSSGFFIYFIDFIIHAFHVPNDLPYRYSFIYTFILILTAGASINNIDKIDNKVIYIVYIILMITLLSLTFNHFEYISNKTIFINMIILSLFTLIIIINEHKIIYLIILVIPISMFEVLYFTNLNWDNKNTNKAYYSNYKPTKKALDYINNNDNNFYRIEKNTHSALNDPSWYGYYGLSTFSSMAYEDLAVLMRKLGTPGNNINSYYYKENTPVYDLMFNIQYKISNYTNNIYMDEYYSSPTVLVHKNTFDTNLIYYSKKSIRDVDINQNAFEIQNNFIEELTGTKNIFKKNKYVSKDLIYNDNYKIDKINYDTNDILYLYFDETKVDFIIEGEKLYFFTDKYDYYYNIQDVIIKDYKDITENHIIVLDSPSTIYVGYSDDNYFDSYILDHDKFNKVTEEIKYPKIHFNKNTIKFKNKGNNYIYTSIPYDDGFKVYSNNKKINTYRTLNNFLGFKLNKTDKNIMIKYEIPYFKLFSVVSFISLLITVCIIKREYK